MSNVLSLCSSLDDPLLIIYYSYIYTGMRGDCILYWKYKLMSTPGVLVTNSMYIVFVKDLYEAYVSYSDARVSA